MGIILHAGVKALIQYGIRGPSYGLKNNKSDFYVISTKFKNFERSLKIIWHINAHNIFWEIVFCSNFVLFNFVFRF